MANANTIQLSPKTVSLEEDSVDEDEVEAGSNDEETVKFIAMSLDSGKKQVSKETQSTGIMKRVGRILGIGSQISNAEENFLPNKHRNNRNSGRANAAMDAKREGDVTGDHTTPPSHRKRDIKGVTQAPPEEERDEGDDVEEPAPKRAKSSRTSKKVKPPLISPLAPSTSQRQTRANTKAASKASEPEMDHPIPSPAGTNGAVTGLEPQKKRGPGRPPVRQKEHSLEQPDGDDAEEIEDSTPEPMDAVNGVSEILMNSSPIKPVLGAPPKTQKPKLAERLSRQTHPPNGVTAPQTLKIAQRLEEEPGTSPLKHGVQEVSDSADEFQDEEQIPMDRPAPDAPEGQDKNADGLEDFPKMLKDVIAIESLEEMLEDARRVGYKQDRDTKKWQQKKKKARETEPPFTAPGKRLLRRFQRLIKAYGTLRAATAAGSDLKTIELKISALVEIIKEEFEIVFSERLENPAKGTPDADTQSIHAMLMDIYFVLVPNLVEVLKLAVEAHQEEEFSKTAALEEIFDLADLLRQLAKGATRQRPSCQPKAPKNNQHRISYPTQLILPKIRSIHKILMIEIRKREHVEKIATWNSGEAERNRKKSDGEEREKKKKQRQRLAVHRLQREAFEARLRRYPNLQAEIDREEARIMEMQFAKSAQLRHKRTSQRSSAQISDCDDGERMEDDPFDDQHERLKGVFPHSNATKYRSPKPLSEEEKEAFIDTMRYGDKEARYEEAARLLNRSMDDIFGFAKELQEAMDDAHEVGKFTRVHDEWTYDIWVGQQ